MKLTKKYLAKEAKEPKISKMSPKQRLHEKGETKTKEKAEHTVTVKLGAKNKPSKKK